MRIAVTGCLGTGKSTVSKLFASVLGAEYLDTDQLCRQQMEPGAEGLAQFIDIFGKEYLCSDGTLDRPRLRKAVFADYSVKVGLENILHPIVRDEVTTKSQASDKLAEDVVVEVPLLYEVGWQDEFDFNILVYVSEPVCIKRVTVRDGLSVSEIRQVLDAQLPIEEKRDNAHYIVDNSGTFASTIQQVWWVAKKLAKH